MVSLAPKYFGWVECIKVILIFLITFLFVLNLHTLKSFAATTEIIAFVSPVREIVVDSNNNLVEVYSNTGLDVFPVVHSGTINGKIIPMNQSALTSYRKILPNINFSKYGLVYKKENKQKNFLFFISITLNILTDAHH